jgi:5'-nucleotidase
LAKDVDVVLSGVNQGANLGVDTAVSGTVAAAREATLHVRTAIAISQYRHPSIEWAWEHVPTWTRSILTEIISANQNVRADAKPDATLWNINLPAIDASTLAEGQVPPVVYCPLDLNPHQRTAEVENDTIRFATNFQARKRDPGTDIDLCFGGSITVTRLGYGNGSASKTQHP